MREKITFCEASLLILFGMPEAGAGRAHQELLAVSCNLDRLKSTVSLSHFPKHFIFGLDNLCQKNFKIILISQVCKDGTFFPLV